MRLKIAAVLVLPALLVLGGPATGAASGTISGQVVARTAGAPAAAAVDVTLRAFMKETGEEVGSGTAVRTDASGRFSFTGLETGTDRGYVVTVPYRGVTYSSDLIVFDSGNSEATASVDVYEPTDAPDWIWLRQQHVIVTPDKAAGTLQVVEIAIVQNGGDRTFVGRDGGAGVETLRLSLPAQAYDLDMNPVLARSAAMQPGALVYTGALLPGSTELVVSYSLGYSGSYTLARPLTLDADAVDVLVQDAGVAVRSRQLSGPTIVEISGTKFQRLSGRGIAAGTVVSLEFGSASVGDTVVSQLTSSLAPLGLVALVGATGCLLLAPRLRRRRPERTIPLAAKRAAVPRREDDDELLLEADE